jgi:hypothetical protein
MKHPGLFIITPQSTGNIQQAAKITAKNQVRVTIADFCTFI